MHRSVTVHGCKFNDLLIFPFKFGILSKYLRVRNFTGKKGDGFTIHQNELQSKVTSFKYSYNKVTSDV